MHLPDSRMQRIPFGKPWLKLDVGAVAKATGASQGNPADMLQALKGVGGSRKLGAENVGGTATTHYRATIDPQKALARIPDAQSSGLLKQMLSSAHLGSIPIDVWVDRGGRVRRESIKFAAAGTSMDMTVNFTRYGAAVDIAPPPADQVLDARSLLGA